MAAPVVFDGTSLEAQVLQAAQELQAAELAVVPAEGEEQPNRVQVSFDADAGEVAISFTIPVTMTSTDAGLVLEAVPYA